MSESITPKKVLVTGGAGFIGSHLCESLAQNGVEVCSLDNYSTGSPKNHIPKVTYIAGRTVEVESLITFDPDVVYHLGEYSRVEQSFSDIQKVLENNGLGTVAILEFCRKKNAKLVYAGSSTKFGDGGLGRNQSPYAWSKASNTDLVMNYGTWFGLRYAIAYFYNAYGPREISTGKYATLIGIFRESMKQKKALQVVKPGNQLRNFTHVSDIVSGLLATGERGIGDGYGIGASEALSVEEVARMFGGEIEYLPARAGNRLGADIDTSKTQALGWNPRVSLESYINTLKSRNWEPQ